MKKEVVVQMTNSTEATPIAHLVQLANQFQSQVYFEMDSKKVNAKSIMGMMSLVLTSGSRVTVSAEGEDESEAVTAMEKFLTA
ncbi:MAG TPA: HPr family phosphocarrier protein [Lachnospiraceae bacterium]|jgi:catabolite repression HPr-like protein|nr:HPr family phosphocarrier protein [Lachnospiraceae bacterium]MDD6148602.1 HPr family phosphocarrier protein [Lachnospiraceae bacterium]MDY5705214.1 HPr family phosphocarrier protein [Lachnospiraceae bacterium]MEE3356805.1 HPr family phosphocarrier protein [Lachnospiraceae bacterium]HAN50420.1 HPr family phosphocarrier protein [Lachnospiraceae bacterium]